jgi:1-acyl-sn-glycerol-3-phosphate acyltransferase
LFVGSLVWGAVITLFGWLPFFLRYELARAWAGSNIWLAKIFCGLDWVVEGHENLPREGAHITMWKHTSAWEAMAQMVILPPSAWVYKRELLWIPLVGWAARFMRGIAIDRGSGHRAVNQILDQGRARLAAGMWVMIFPEGTRVAPGETRKYGLSGALLASQTGVKIIPIAHNAGDFWPRRGLFKKPGLIRVVIGPPIETTGREPRELNAAVQRWMDKKMQEISAAVPAKPGSLQASV